MTQSVTLGHFSTKVAAFCKIAGVIMYSVNDMITTSFQKQGRRLTAYLSGELDDATSRSVKTRLDDVVAVGGYDVLELDLSGLSFMDSTGVGVILGRYKKLQQHGKILEISGAPVSVKKVLTACGMDAIIKIS